ncbi:MAG: hypothetical protein JO112_08120 [Planctomycetes bacterium]|nr:hypothetical protein [Planctomycetota bacterium]
MRSDTKALFQLIGCCFVLVIVLGAISGTAAMKEWLTQTQAGYLLLGGLLVGAVVLGRWFRPALRPKPPDKDKDGPDLIL